MVRHQGKQVIALGVSMAKGGDIIALGKALQAAAATIQAELPAGIELRAGPGPADARCRARWASSSSVLIEAVVIVLAVSFISLGLHTKPLRIDIWPGLVVGITIPLVLAITFVTMYYWGVGPAQDLAGLADHRAGPAGRRRDHRGRDDGAQARGGLRQARAPPPSPTS